MAGQRPTTTEQREQQNHTYQYSFTAAQLGTTQYLPLFTAEVPTVIEYASFRASTINGAARTVRLLYAPSGTAPGSGTDITTTIPTSTITADVTYSTEPESSLTEAQKTARYWGFMDNQATPAAMAYGSLKLPGANVIPKGATVFMAFNNGTSGTLDSVVLNVRVTEKVF